MTKTYPSFLKVGDLVRPKYYGPLEPAPEQPLGIVIQVDYDGYYVSVLLGGYNKPQPWYQASLELINAN
jgi:hypothetical protein